MIKKEFFKKVASLTLAATMMVGATACGGEKAPDAGKTTPTPTQAVSAEPTPDAEAQGPKIYTDKNGNTVDLGGVHIIIRDWWSGEVGHEQSEPTNEYEEARQEYLEWAQETYNFTIEQAGISTWASTPEDFNNYAINGGDENYYLFILRAGTEVTSAMNSDLMFDLSKLDCLDFSQPKWSNGVHKYYSKGNSIYAMSGETPEPKGGMYFNKRLLKEAGIEPDSIYELQESGDWTWDKFEEICSKIQVDRNSDGEIDQYAMVNFGSTFYSWAVMSNYAHFIGKDKNGMLFNALETNETLYALNWALDMLSKYDYPQPADTEWNYWAEAFINGKGVFIAGETYQAGQDWKDMVDDFGFVCFPKGPNATDYTNWLNDNPFAIPSCYDTDKAWKIAFAYNIWTDPVPGFEDYNGRISGFYQSFRDAESVDLTINRLMSNGTVTYHNLVSGLQLGSDLIWGISKDSTPAQRAEAIRDTWNSYVEEANK